MYTYPMSAKPSMPALTRRQFAAGLAAALFAGSGAPAAAAPLPKSRKQFSNLISYMNKVTPKTDVLFFADNNHYDPDVGLPLQADSFMRAAARSGYTDLYLEAPRSFQPAANSLAAGRFSLEQFVGFALGDLQQQVAKVGITGPSSGEIVMQANKTGQMIQCAARNGITPHMADPQDRSETIALFSGKYTLDEIIELRMRKYDPEVAKYIVSTKRGRALVMYGSMHAELDEGGFLAYGAANIDDALQARGLAVTTILMNNEMPPEYVADITPAYFRDLERGKKYYQKPDCFYRPLTDAIFETPRPRRAARNLFEMLLNP